MSSGQIPVWVTIVVALLGMSGIITGQLINSWREGRRWERDQHREDLRWQRLVILDSAKMALEHQGQWREVKVKTYGQLLRALESCGEAAIHLEIAVRDPECGQWLSKVEEHIREVEVAVNEASLIASDELLECLELVFLSPPFDTRGLIDSEEEGSISLRTEAAAIKVESRSYRSKILELAREEMKVRPALIEESRS